GPRRAHRRRRVHRDVQRRRRYRASGSARGGARARDRRTDPPVERPAARAAREHWHRVRDRRRWRRRGAAGGRARGPGAGGGDREAGGSNIEIFDRDLQVQAERRRQLELALRAAIETDQIDVHYQPIVSVNEGRVLGAEALARFTHPVLGPIPPADFIRVAEESDLILSLGLAVLAKACAQTAHWRASDRHARGLYVSVNPSAPPPHDPPFVAHVADVPPAPGLDPAPPPRAHT